jgi:hypothetical protein
MLVVGVDLQLNKELRQKDGVKVYIAEGIAIADCEIGNEC